jgi:polysaccharide deacetylase 2 family uncharacterized protein YibQ
MAEKPTSTSPAAPDAKPPSSEEKPEELVGQPMPHSWGKLALGCSLLVLGSVLGGWLLAHYLQSRPINLVYHTDRLGAGLLSLLRTNGIPTEQIQHKEPALRRDGDSFWHFFEFAVEVPSSLSAAGVARLIDKDMAERGVNVVRAAAEAYLPDLHLSYAGREFALVHLMSRAPEAPSRAPLPQVELPQVPAPTSPRDGRQAPGPQATASIGPALEEIPLDSAELSEPDLTAPPATSPGKVAGKPRVAIVVDDGGYGGPVTEAILILDPRLTLSILPGAPFAAATAQQAAQRGFELMLHMPMESASNATGVPGSITTDMSQEALHTATESALAQVPGVAGINNHAGSAFTADETAMRAFLSCLQNQPLYFLDSRTTADSKAFGLAKELRIPSAVRDVFLDNQQDIEYIRRQFDVLVELGKQRGSAIGVCHFRPVTAEALAELLPRLQAEGVELVHASELAQ